MTQFYLRLYCQNTILLLFLFCSINTFGYSQFLDNSEHANKLVRILDNLYNQDKEIFFQNLKDFQYSYPNSPAVPYLKSMQLAQELGSFKKNKVKAGDFKISLENTIKKTILLNMKGNSREHSEDEIFFMIGGWGGLARFHFENGDFFNSLASVNKSYKYIKSGLAIAKKGPEILYPLGLYLYFRERYQEDHPEIKPALTLLKKGDKTQGISFLETAFKHGNIVKYEAGFALASLLLKYENNPKEAQKYLQVLLEKYPKNVIFNLKHMECLIMLNKSSEIQREKSFSTDNEIYNNIFSLNKAFSQLDKTHSMDSHFVICHNFLKLYSKDPYMADYLSFTHFYLAKYYSMNKEYSKMELHLKEIRKRTDWTWLKLEATKIEI